MRDWIFDMMPGAKKSPLDQAVDLIMEPLPETEPERTEEARRRGAEVARLLNLRRDV